MAVSTARTHSELTEVATSGPWVAFSVAGSELVTPLEFQPAVITDVGHAQDEWLDVGVEFFENPAAQDVFLAKDGPASWERVELIEVAEPPVAEGEAPPHERWGGVVPVTEPQRVAATPTTVSEIATDTSKISFSVDQIGQPVLVKTSYFPNWKVSGAEGPYRVTPNLMVVVPTSNDITLSYGHTWVEWFSWMVTLAGIAGLVLLTREDKRKDVVLFDPVGTWMSTPPLAAPAAVATASTVGAGLLVADRELDPHEEFGADVELGDDSIADNDDSIVADSSDDSIVADSSDDSIVADSSIESSYDAGYDDGYEDGFRDGESGTHRSGVDPPDA